MSESLSSSKQTKGLLFKTLTLLDVVGHILIWCGWIGVVALLKYLQTDLGLTPHRQYVLFGVGVLMLLLLGIDLIASIRGWFGKKILFFSLPVRVLSVIALLGSCWMLFSPLLRELSRFYDSV